MNTIQTAGLNNIYKSYRTEALYIKTRALYPARNAVSFGAMKKSAFSGIDLAVINKFKAPIEKFNSLEDFYNWCREKTKEHVSKTYNGRTRKTSEEREKILNMWFDVCADEKKTGSPALSLLIIEGITSDLQENEDTLPPDLNRLILADTVNEIMLKSKNNPKYNVNFKKLYEKKAAENILYSELRKTKDYTGWIHIPSRDSSPDDYKDNLKRLQMLSHPNWCTKSHNAEFYLSSSDFDIYLDKGTPKAAIKSRNGIACEIQGEANNWKIPLQYLEAVQKKAAGYMLDVNSEFRLFQAQQAAERIKEFKQKIGVPLNEAPVEDLLKEAGMFEGRTDEGGIILSHYGSPGSNFSWSDLGVDENRFFEEVQEIKGDALFSDSNAVSLQKLQIIGGNADFSKSNITDTGSLEIIEGDAYFSFSKMKSTGRIKEIGGKALFCASKIENADNIEEIGGDAYFGGSKIKRLPKLKRIGGNADFSASRIKSAENLEEIGGNANFCSTELASAPELKCIKGLILGLESLPPDLLLQIQSLHGL